MWHVIGSKGCGSVIAEAALMLTNIPFDREEVDYTTPSPARDRLLAKNPLGQVPTLITPDGQVMTESAAIVLHLDDVAPAARLLPARGTPERRDALRWLVFFVAAIYPTFTYGDEPSKWVGDVGGRLRESTHAHRETLWNQVEGAAKGPWFLGETRSILDVYIAAMTRWRPGRPWFEKHTPVLAAIARTVDVDPVLAPLWTANFD
ncbi:MAG: glutathione S-transferase family protein [Kofleriaceae bacterium]